MLKPCYETENGILLHGSYKDVLPEIPADSVQCCITSPPYWGLRDYGVDGQLGLEKTPEEYVEKIVEVFKEVKRTLKDNGILFLNLGDSYWGGKGQSGQAWSTNHTNRDTLNKPYHQISGTKETRPQDGKHDILKPKDLIGIPWRVAFALQADGWYLRSDIIWHKPNPMPESVKDRCTKSHEYIFLLTKSAEYYYNADAIKEPLLKTSIKRNQSRWDGNEDRDYINGPQNHISKYLGSETAKKQTHRNKRSVWTVTIKSYKGAHSATYPEKLIEPCVLAGTKKGDTIIDPFFGAGTTGVVACKYGRKFIGIELNQEYCEIAAQRISREIQQTKMF